MPPLPATTMPYSLMARTLPMVLAMAPLIAVAAAVGSVLPLPGIAVPGSALLVTALTALATQLSRDAGKRIQPELWRSWGGAPATQLMRWRNPRPSAVAVAVRHQHVQALVAGSLPLPTPAEEQADPDGADQAYDVALGIVRGLARDPVRFSLLHKENAAYGFRRNLLGLRRLGQPASLGALASAAVFIGLAAASHSAVDWFWGGCLVVVAVASLVMWARASAAWVEPIAWAYADRLLEAAQVLAAVPVAAASA